MKATHFTDRKEYPCNLCTKIYYARTHLNVHLLSHSDERPFKCNKCEATFKRKSKLKRHMNIHDSTKRFSCEVSECNVEYLTLAPLKRHMLQVHGLAATQHKADQELVT